MDSKYIVTFGVIIIGFSVAVLAFPVDAGIPPTKAIQKINVDTSHWYGTDTWVNASNSRQELYFVTDGSIIMNVTTTP